MPKQIQLTQGKVAIVDDCDFDRVSQYKWQAERARSGLWYAITTMFNPKRTVRLHRLILNAPDGVFVDHIDGNGLNNRRNNIRLCDQMRNMRNSRIYSNNTSGYKGVSWRKDAQRWIAYITVDGKKKYLGRFATAEEAARAYDEAAIRYYGEFARINFQEGNTR